MKINIKLPALIIIFSFSIILLNAQSIGINTASPDGSSALDIVSTSKGLLIPRMNSGQRTAIVTPAVGLLVFDVDTNSFWYRQSSGWFELVGGAFTNDAGTVRSTGNQNTDDFVFGAESLPPSTTINDTLLFFDKSKGALRVGTLTNSANWGAAQIGNNSFASGKNTRASGESSAAFGDATLANAQTTFTMGEGTVANGTSSFAGGFESFTEGLASISFGNMNVASSNYTTAFGNQTSATFTAATAMGDHTLAEGVNTTALGEYTRARSRSSTALGIYNVGFGDQATLASEDPLLEVGMGVSNTLRENAMTVTKSGNIIFGPHQLPTNGANSNDKMMFFNRAKSALRIGLAQTKKWSPDSLGSFSIAVGNGTLAYGYASASFGSSSRAVASQSMAVGSSAISKGLTSIAMGNNVQANSMYSMAVGSFNEGLGSSNNWIPTDPVFEVGIGQDNVNRANAITILKNGNVGIGTSTPDGLLQVDKNSTLSNPQILINEIGNDYARVTFKNDQDPSYWTLAGRPSSTSSTSKFNIYNSVKGDVFSVNADGNAYISERLAIGPTTLSAALQVNSLPFEDALRLQVDGSTKIRLYSNGSIALGGNYGDPAPTGSANDVFIVNQMSFGVANPTFRLQIENDATNLVGSARATAWSTYSDARIKKNVKDINYGLQEVLKLKPVSYNHHSSTFENGKLIVKDDSSVEIGFIAQEVYAIINEIVDKPNDESIDLWSMDYEKLTPVLVKAIQEQQEVLLNQKREIEELKKNNDKLLIEINNQSKFFIKEIADIKRSLNLE